MNCAPVFNSPENIKILEIDELFTIWLAIDRNRNQVIDFQVTKKRDFSAYYQSAARIEQHYKVKSCVLMLIKYTVNTEYRCTLYIKGRNFPC